MSLTTNLEQRIPELGMVTSGQQPRAMAHGLVGAGVSVAGAPVSKPRWGPF